MLHGKAFNDSFQQSPCPVALLNLYCLVEQRNFKRVQVLAINFALVRDSKYTELWSRCRLLYAYSTFAKLYQQVKKVKQLCRTATQHQAQTVATVPVLKKKQPLNA